ncbi:MAG: glycerophosphodiester phosphodiesterase [Methylococcaceae bacterium]|nr:glycerophosphodiester phosphodiesterase [Methylococcaceae bacterium]
MFLNDTTGTLNIAHRGTRAYAPENTLAAFAKSKLFGCELIELDVRLSKDGEVVVYHDEHLKRCTDVIEKFPGRSTYQVADFTLRELKNLDAGSWYIDQLSLLIDKRELFLQSVSDDELAQFVTQDELKHFASGEIKIPTLIEVFCLAGEIDLTVNVELKSCSGSDALLVSNVLEIIRTMNMEDRILISSFNHELLITTRKQSKKIRTAALVDKLLNNPLTYLKRLKANAYNLGCYRGFSADRYQSKAGDRYLQHIKKLRLAGFDVNVWTCNDRDEMEGLLSAGVTGLISDYPNRVKEKIEGFRN